ncbi:hypothetical protein [Microbacterium stercoris]|uniref:Uncharacterized protein n=1 Tax=Microbacterium stercoris TaxID=2820289 RepID=A0A939QL85_9MICO|nr:hypothetical protein [Microbacterium stercoris]MBO3663747.1 hypothetical protein [Microbacterium stercoris]
MRVLGWLAAATAVAVALTVIAFSAVYLWAVVQLGIAVVFLIGGAAS